MKLKLTLRLVLALICCSCYSLLVAQTDSSWLDLGRIKLKKEFTQTVTIKGKDLEQMPFANLADAINVWLYGLATNKGSVVYVIDGNLITDVNVYSVHDIEEITLVQNALVQLNGATKEQQLVLVTTRKNRDKSAGINVAGSSFAVTNSFQNTSGDKQKGETNFYHQYYVSAYKNQRNIQYGVSASYLRDVYPYPKDGYNMKDPYHVNRFRFNGYLNATIDAGNNIWLRAGYVPSKLGLEYSNSISQVKSKNTFSYFTVEAGWQSRLFNKLTNELSAGFTPVTNRGSVNSLTAYPGTSGIIVRQDNAGAKTRINNLLINDNITYHAGFGNWHIEPAVNFTWRYIKHNYKANAMAIDLPATVIAMNEVANEYKYNIFLLTPAVNLYYKNSFNIQGGFVYNLSKQQQSYSPKSKKWLPFVTATVDVLKAFEPDSKTGWKVYGSYAAAGNFADDLLTLHEATPFIQYPYPYDYNPNYSNTYLNGGDSSNYMVHAGTSVQLWNDRLQVGYGFEKRKNSDVAVTYLPWSPVPVFTAADIFNTIHRLGITAKIVEGTRVNWLTGLNGSVIKTEVKVHGNAPITPASAKQDDPLWTGGWVNRISFQQWKFGLDVLYVFNQLNYSVNTWGKNDAFSFRNIYAGYQFVLRQRPLDVYAECRNPGQKNESNIPDRREYYGLGFKAAL
jgi:hypothetical protein